jgi:hypothetical protein
MNTNPRIPWGEQETFAMAFMIGYIGWVPDDLAAAFPNETFENCPEFVPNEVAHEWKRGYDCGVAFYCDHALDEDE